MNAAIALTRRELLRLVREPTRLVALFGTTLVFWLVIGAGFASSFAPPTDEESYAAYLVPGIVLMIALFGSIMGAIGLIQDRQDGFLQSVLVSPAPAWSVVFSKSAVGVCAVLLQTAPLVVGARLLGVEVTPAGALLSLLGVAFASVGVLCVGLLLAWRINSVSGFHGVMNLVLLPMWLLSGALFPVEGAAGWMGFIMRLNPMHWGHRTIAGPLGVGPGAGVLAWSVTVLFALVVAGACVVQINTRSAKGG
ncbi:MAG: ABC transporter permease [Planctomycetota bacterium]